MKEKWKPIPRLPTHEASSYGRIRNRLTGLYANARLIGKTCRYNRIRVQNNYFLVHRIVYEAFNGPIAKGMTIDHKDGDRFNNRPENLEQVTLEENRRRAGILPTPMVGWTVDGRFLGVYGSRAEAIRKSKLGMWRVNQALKVFPKPYKGIYFKRIV